MNPTVVFLAVTALVLLAFFIPGPAGGALLLVVAAAAVALLVGGWQRTPLAGRVLRMVVIALIVGVALRRILS